ncbi:MAG: phospholipid/cholesterol/gamma-HCH transport system substrate-binding protein [Solirubrobacterales bacterium]|nr:phospholipid/cholesterol/gamma-HCH transport system substrate-binding protein [Solirubrobacterales bacterium]
MNPATAKLSAVASVVLIAAAALFLWVSEHPSAGATTVNAEFEDAFPIVAGMNVRISGAVAGSVRGVTLTDHGTAMVTLSLNEGTAPPRSDASAAIRQQDITGDSYVSLSPGSAPGRLGDGTIPVARTLVAPRFDDLLNSFEQPERRALQIVLVEAGKALERNGADVNAAALQLRPALTAADRVLSEVGSQNQALQSLVTDAEKVTGQAAGRSRELGGLVDSLSSTLRTTAEHGPALDSALVALPQTASRLRGTLTRLRHTAVAARPLANAIADGTPQLTRTLRLAGPFLGDARKTVDRLVPTLGLTTHLLREARPALQASPRHVITAPFELTGSIDDLLRTLLGNEDVLRTLFGADGYGAAPANANDVGFAATAVETGAQSGYEQTDPSRGFLRTTIIPSCQMFGLPVAPGCLTDAIAQMSKQQKRDRRGGNQAVAPVPASPVPSGTDAAGSPPALGGSPPKPPAQAPTPAPAPGNGNGDASALLDFLFGSGK